MRVLTLAGLAVLFAAPVAAQQPQQQETPPPMVAVSYYKCSAPAADVDAIIDAWTRQFTQLETDGNVLGWGVLQHAWADEWNLIVYRTVADLAGLQRSLDAQTALTPMVPDLADRLLRACPEHKDNIYWLRAAGPAAPPTNR